MSADYDRLFGPSDGPDDGDERGESAARGGYDVSPAAAGPARGAAAAPTSNGHGPPPMPIVPPQPTSRPPHAAPRPAKSTPQPNGHQARHAMPDSPNGKRAQNRSGPTAVSPAAPSPTATARPNTDRRAAARPGPTRPATALTGGPSKRAAKPVPSRGWRRRLHRITRINLGLSRDEKHEADLRSRINSRNPRGSYQIGVLGLKGGAGRTALTVALGSLLADLRGDRILVIDGDPASGNLADRAGRDTDSTIVDLAAASSLANYNDVRRHTSVNSVNLEVLAGEDYSSARHILTADEWNRTVESVSRFYNLVVTDAGDALPPAAMRMLLSQMSAVVIVANASVDGARQVMVALDWLQRNGFQDLANRACVVITQLVPGVAESDVHDLARRFERRVAPGRIVVVPFDKHIAAGTEIRPKSLSAAYTRQVMELAAVLSDDFERAGVR